MPGEDKAVIADVLEPAGKRSSLGPEVEGAIKAALMVLENGGTTRFAERTFSNILTGFHIEDVTIVWRVDCAFIAVRRGNGQADSLVIPVGPIGLNLTRVSGASALGERMAKQPLDPAALALELERIRKLPPAHNRWAMALAAACAGVFFSKTASGDIGSLGVCGIAAGLGQLARSELQAIGLTRASTTFICSLFSGLIATIGLRLGFTQATAATLMASVIYTVPGLLLINGFLDLTTEKYLIVGSQRLLHASFLFLLITIAVVLIDAVL